MADVWQDQIDGSNEVPREHFLKQKVDLYIKFFEATESIRSYIYFFVRIIWKTQLSSTSLEENSAFPFCNLDCV